MRPVALLLASTLFAPAVLAEVHEVKMLNRGSDGAMVYEPDHLRIAPGDSVRFLPSHSGHNAASVAGLLVYLGKKSLFDDIGGPGLPASLTAKVLDMEQQGRTVFVVRQGDR